MTFCCLIIFAMESIRIKRLREGFEGTGELRPVFVACAGHAKAPFVVMHRVGASARQALTCMKGFSRASGLDAVREIGGPHAEHFHLSAWTKLFWAGYNIEDLRKLGFRGEIDEEVLAGMLKRRSSIQEMWLGNFCT